MTAIEFVVVMAALVSLIFGAVQVGLWFYGRTVAEAAANRGAQAATAGSGTDATGQLAGENALSSLGPLGSSPAVQVVDAGGDVMVSTSTSIMSIVPFLPAVQVRASVVMHRELP